LITGRWSLRSGSRRPSILDSHLHGQSFLMIIQAQGFPPRPGNALTAHLESPEKAKPGVVIPEAAVVRTGDRAWAYVQIAPAQFERRQLVMTSPAARGWFVTTGFAAGDRSVVTGAQALLSEELKSQIQGSRARHAGTAECLAPSFNSPSASVEP
jgi:hypothetical protein